MTKLLEKAMGRVNKLSDSAQDEIAQIIINELESERAWDRKFAQSQSVLERLAIDAIIENRTGKTRDLKI